MRKKEFKDFYYLCFETVLHNYLGLMSLNYPRYKFFQGRWYTKRQWDAWQRIGIFREKITQKHFPEIYKKQTEYAKYLLENPLPIPD